MRDALTSFRKLHALLSLQQRRAAVVLLGFILVGMALETLGVGLVVPAVALLVQADLLVRYPLLNELIGRVGNPSHAELVMGGMGMLIGVYTIKVMFLAFLLWRQQHFVYGLQAGFSRRLFAGYLHQPYTFHLQRNSAQLILNVTGEVSQLISLAQSLLMLVAELLVCLGIAVLLLILEPAGAILVAATLGGAGWLFHRATSGRVLLWGEARQLHEGLRIQHLQQGLGGVKDVKVLGREGVFLEQYDRHNVVSASVSRRHQTLQQLPRLGLELLAVIGLTVLVAVMIAQGKSPQDILPSLGLFGAAAFRLMPSANRIVFTVQTIRFLRPVADTLSVELGSFGGAAPAARTAPLKLEKALTMQGVSFRYPGAASLALRDISLSIAGGSTVGFVGQSGAGKSTLVDILLGLLAPGSGTVRVDGIDIQSNLRGWQDGIGYVPQSIFLTDDSLRRNVAFGLPDDQIDEAAVWRALRAAQLDAFVKSLPDGLETNVGERGIRLSGGQRQRIGIARALYHDPAVLVLDEATSSLDTATESGVMEAIGALHGQKTIVIVAHRLSTVARCDYLFRLDQGCVIRQGSAAIVLQEQH